MRKILSSKYSLAIQSVILFICTYVICSFLSWQFQYLVYNTFPINIIEWLIPCLILALIIFPTFVYSLWFSELNINFKNIDFPRALLIISILLVILFIIGMMQITLVFTLIVIPIVMFGLGLFLLIILVFRVQTQIQKYVIVEKDKYEAIIQEKIKSERFKTELITNVSHDIKTPLTSIINYIDLIKRLNIENQVLNGYVNILDKKSLRLKMLINDLIEASKIGTGNVKVEMNEIDIMEIVGQVIGEFEDSAANSDLEIVFKHTEESLFIVSDGRHLWRILENILGNAIKYSQPKTRIYAEVKKENQQILLSLKNISKEKLGISADELMEQFVRGDRSRHEEGSGLGLYIAKSLTELIGGEFGLRVSGDMFEVEIRVGEGSVYWV